MGASTLEARFARNLESLGSGVEPTRLLVAFSGGLDSTVLLYLLRLHADALSLSITAAHFDHRMREASATDAAWARGICRAWEIPCEMGIAREELRNEEEARIARYAFLRAAAASAGATRIATAHHADDQAETVLFRILRGTGLEGLAGIPASTKTGLVRPLLPFWREELEEYAVERGLAWRCDPTNDTLGPVRNRIRHEILPRIEQEVSGTARKNLVALAEQARESEQGWREIVNAVYPRVVAARGDTLVIDRDALRKQSPAVAARVLRKALRRFGIVPDRSGTRLALTFITDAPSGREIQLAGGVRIRIEFDRARLHREQPSPEDDTLSVELPDEGGVVEGEVTLGGRKLRVSARRASSDARMDGNTDGDGRWHTRVRVPPDRFPLTIRSRVPGDRVRTRAGTRSLKRLMIDARIPSSERSSRPVVVDATGQVVWVPGLPVLPTDAPGAPPVDLTVADA